MKLWRRAAGLSRTPVREALRRLDAEGLVRMVPNQGATVTGWTESDIAEMFALRAVLESYAAERAATRLTEAQIDRIAELAEQTHDLARDPAARVSPGAGGGEQRAASDDCGGCGERAVGKHDRKRGGNAFGVAHAWGLFGR